MQYIHMYYIVLKTPTKSKCDIFLIQYKQINKYLKFFEENYEKLELTMQTN